MATPSPQTTSSVVVRDLRGVRVHATAEPVLLDASGQRARRLRAAGRVVGALFLLWFCGLILAGLGLLPARGLPLASVVAADTAPPSLTRIPVARPTSARDRTPALALVRPGVVRTGTVPVPGTGGTVPAGARERRPAGTPTATPAGANAKAKATKPRPAPKPAAGVTAGVGNGKGKGNGRPATTPGSSATTTPAATTSQGTAKGKSTTAPGKTKTTTSASPTPTPAATTSTPATTTTPGSSGTAPGHGTTSPGQGKGNGHTTTTP